MPTPDPHTAPLASPTRLRAAPPVDPGPGQLSRWAQRLHDEECGCATGADLAAHDGVDFQGVAAVLGEGLADVDYRPPRIPRVVWAAAGGALASGATLALVTAALTGLGPRPALAAVTLTAWAVLPAVAALAQGWLAAHSRRSGDES